MELVVSTVLDLYRSAFGSIRKEISGLDAESLTWNPAPETNSIAVLIVHTLGSAEEVLRIVRGLPSDRDRDAEFVPVDLNPDAIGRLIEKAEHQLDEVGSGITSADLAAVRERRGREPATGIYWLLRNYGHAREHLAHIELTRQLLAARTGA